MLAFRPVTGVHDRVPAAQREYACGCTKVTSRHDVPAPEWHYTAMYDSNNQALSYYCYILCCPSGQSVRDLTGRPLRGKRGVETGRGVPFIAGEADLLLDTAATKRLSAVA